MGALMIWLVLLIWFKTSAFAEYVKLFAPRWLVSHLRVQEFFELKNSGFSAEYVKFLEEFYFDFFIVRLLKCEICVSTQLGVILTLLNWYHGFPLYYAVQYGLGTAALGLLLLMLYNKLLE